MVVDHFYGVGAAALPAAIAVGLMLTAVYFKDAWLSAPSTDRDNPSLHAAGLRQDQRLKPNVSAASATSSAGGLVDTTCQETGEQRRGSRAGRQGWIP